MEIIYRTFDKISTFKASILNNNMIPVLKQLKFRFIPSIDIKAIIGLTGIHGVFMI